MSKVKSNSVIQTAINTEARTVTFTVLGVTDRPIVLDLNKVSQSNTDYAAFHGFKQRVADKAALPCDEVTGKSASPREKYDAMFALVDYYNSGSDGWSPARTGEGGGTSGMTKMLKAALLAAYPTKTEADIEKFLDGKSRKQQAALIASDVVKPHYEKLVNAATAGVDIQGLLSELD